MLVEQYIEKIASNPSSVLSNSGIGRDVRNLKILPHLSISLPSIETLIFLLESVEKQCYYIFSVSKNGLNNSKLKPLIFKGQSILKNPKLTKVIQNDTDEGLVCFVVNDSYFGFVKNICEEVHSEEKIFDVTLFSVNKSFQIRKLRFSYFSNYIGVLSKDGVFRFFSIDSPIPLFALNVPQKMRTSLKVVDFNFFPKINNDCWNAFSALFLFADGTFSVCGPFFPKFFELSVDMFSRIIDSKTISKNKNDNYIGTITKALENSSSREKDRVIKIVPKDFLLKMNQDVNFSPVDIINNSTRKLTQRVFKQFHFLKSFPFTVLRVDQNNKMDVLILDGDIKPTQKNSQESDDDLLFYVAENIELEIYGDIQIIDQKSTFNLDTKYSLIIFGQGNLFLVEIPYLPSLKTMLFSNGEYCFSNFTSEVYQLLECKSTNFNQFSILPCTYMSNIVVVKEPNKIKFFPLTNESIQGRSDSESQNVQILDKKISGVAHKMREIFSEFEEILSLEDPLIKQEELDRFVEEDSDKEALILQTINHQFNEAKKILNRQTEAFETKLEKIQGVNSKFSELVPLVKDILRETTNELDEIQSYSRKIDERKNMILERVQKLSERVKEGMDKTEEKKIKIPRALINKVMEKYVKDIRNTIDQYNSNCNELQKMKREIINEFNKNKEIELDTVLNKENISKDLLEKYGIFRGKIEELKREFSTRRELLNSISEKLLTKS